MEVTMLDYIKESETFLQENIRSSRALTKTLVDFYLQNHLDNITIIGCGSSYNSSNCARFFMEKYLKRKISIVTPFTFANHETKPDLNDLVICASQSGCSTNTIEALALLQEHKTVALTGKDDCDMAQYASIHVNWQMGNELIGYATKGVVTMALFLMLFALEVSIRKGYINEEEYEKEINELSGTTSLHRQLVEETCNIFEKNKEDFLGFSRAYLLSSGANYGTIIEGALKITETTCKAVQAFEVEEFLHGPCYALNPDCLIITVDNNDDPSSSRINEVAQGLRMVTKKIYAITNDKSIDDAYALRTASETDPLVSPLYKLAVFQTLAYLISENSNHYEPCEEFKQFRRSNKIATKSRQNIYMNLQKL